MLRPGQVAALALGAALLGAAGAVAAAPSASHREVRFDQSDHALIPFDLRGSHVWVRGVVGNSDSLWMVVDTGASSSVMDVALARSLGFVERGHQQSRGAGGTVTGGTVADVDIRLPGLTLHRDQLPTMRLVDISTAGRRPMQLVIGHELFAACVVRFDYAAGVMELWDAAHAPDPMPGVGVPMKLLQNLPYVEGVLEVPGRPPIRGPFLIDTGSAASLLVGADVAERESLAAAFPRTLEVLARGVGGEVRNRIGRAGSFSVGAMRFERPTVMLQQASAGRISAPGTVGNIGGQLLGRCRVTFDYPRGRVYFEPGAEFDKPFEAEMSGAVITLDSSGWGVRIVNPDTPAAEAGLRAGDAVTSVDGEPAERLDPPTLRRLMTTEGREVRIGIRRGPVESTVTLRLRRLI
jgi:hypothetical protein